MSQITVTIQVVLAMYGARGDGGDRSFDVGDRTSM